MRWTWIDRIVGHEPERRMIAIKNVSRAEEYLHDHLSGSRRREPVSVMPASLMIEGMAQTAGILVMSVNRFREKVILAKVVSARFDADVLPGETIRYDAVIDRIDTLGAATRGTIERMRHPESRWEPIGAVDLIFSHVDRNRSGLEFPEGNFVFSEHVRVILRDSGLGSLLPA